nr:hypothetical protein CFP56_12157 [Quercus suber]
MDPRTHKSAPLSKPSMRNRSRYPDSTKEVWFSTTVDAWPREPYFVKASVNRTNVNSVQAATLREPCKPLSYSMSESDEDKDTASGKSETSIPLSLEIADRIGIDHTADTF